MTITKELIFDYLAGKASALQKQMIESWLQDQRNEELFYQYLIEYETMRPTYTADVAQAIDNYNQFLKNAGSNTTPGSNQATVVKTRPIWLRWSIAAAVTLLLMTSVWLLRNQWQYESYETVYGQTRNISLPDGSTVVLNANSRLRVPRFGFSSGPREVLLEGEALFSVSHTKTHQRFIVKTDHQFQVEVLGTVFNVFARQRGGKVVLNQGKVNVLFTGKVTRNKVTLKPGQLVTIDPQRIRVKSTPEPEAHAAWCNNRYVFDKTTVQEIGYLLRENYGLTISTTDKELLALTISGSYSASNAGELLQLLEETLGISTSRQGDTVMIARPAVPQPLQ
ncbi:anti-FecI sigma factor, FecR [Fibrisoma limi BUZ 3]|uniref:Anti-FecI sigma factor, FecR n=1 Tax=Fibrisoma limi BUZ 3 TaxID=1185876 RepID=I2GHR8_9BACT|nr:FecR domain-containing protein [Fibrisoma limi]CCH53443.1 anti-FecI sigma factor, FecR [Fibrisoma limi BUZ 3]